MEGEDRQLFGLLSLSIAAASYSERLLYTQEVRDNHFSSKTPSEKKLLLSLSLSLPRALFFLSF